MMWEPRKLGEVLTLQRGFDLPLKDRRDGSIPIISSSGVTGFHDEHKVEGPGVITGRYGTLGEVFYVPGPYWPLNTALWISDFKGNDPRFLSYLLRTLDLARKSVAGAVPGINRNVLHAMDVRIPLLPVQRRIASILSAYDDLIENNTKRIKILEEMARGLFVRVQALGAGVSVERELGEISDEAGGTIRTGPFGSALHEYDYTEKGTPVVMPKDIIDGRVSEATIARVPDEIVQRLDQHILREGDIVYGRRGDIGRRAYIGTRNAGWLCGTGCLRVSLPDGPLSTRYLHEYLGQSHVIALIAGRAVGSTMPNLNTTILRSIPVVVPPVHLQTQFDETVRPIDALRDNLLAQLDVLRSTRDLLLPRLISGSLDVSTLPLPTP